jgi:outer membrane protein assembly factor BamB
MTQATHQTSRKPLRLWPGVVLAVLLLMGRFLIPAVIPDGGIYGILAGVAGGLLIFLWWTFFSRAPWLERLGVIVLMVLAVMATSRLVHESIRGGMMGNMLPIYLGIPLMSLALVAWAAATRGLVAPRRRVALLAVVLLACGLMLLVRTDGITGTGVAQLAWRWTPTAEEQLLAATRDTPSAPAPAPAAALTPEQPLPAATETPTADREKPVSPASAPAETESATLASATAAATAPSTPIAAKAGAGWPGFRGPDRDGVVRGVRIETDWSKFPPVEMWRRPIGPGWSSFAVLGDLLYTQEQRGDDELVSAYRVSTGEPVWRHSDPVRFYESNGGAGPRATPTVSGDRLYTFGATGVLNALDASTGAVIWSRNASADTGVPLPGWGFTSSPLVIDNLVVVATSGALVAYDRVSGDKRWSRPSRGGSYSSPHRATIDGVPQILLMAGSGATSVAPSDGAVLWEHAWAGSPIVQPALTPDGDVLITTADAMGSMGMRRLSAAAGPNGWTIEERWVSRGLKPYFNDFVVHEGHAFGFDGSILSCINLEDGARRWKGGRYGQGQLVLLPEQDVLLILSEEGELALVGATTDQFREIARFPALDAKTWNHPVLVGDVLLIRNGEEMAAFRLPLAEK